MQEGGSGGRRMGTLPPPSASMWLAHEMHPSLSEMDALPPPSPSPPHAVVGGCKGGGGLGGCSQPPSCFAADGAKQPPSCFAADGYGGGSPRTLSSMMRGGPNPWPHGGLQGGSGGVCIPWRSQGKGVGGRCSRRPPPFPPPPPCIPPPPIPKNGGGGCKGGMGKGGADSVLVCLRQTRDASPPTEGTVKAVRQPPRLWIFWLYPCGRSPKTKNQTRFHYIQYIEIYWTNETCCAGRRGQQLLLRGGLPACFASASFPPFYIKLKTGGDQLFYLTLVELPLPMHVLKKTCFFWITLPFQTWIILIIQVMIGKGGRKN
nr:hypothetical protein [Morchella crassipes]